MGADTTTCQISYNWSPDKKKERDGEGVCLREIGDRKKNEVVLQVDASTHSSIRRLISPAFYPNKVEFH